MTHLTAPDETSADTARRWTLRAATTSYTVEIAESGAWAELSSWGPIGVEDGPSPLAGHGRTPFRTAADAAPAEYLPTGQRPFGGAELDVRRPGGERGCWWSFAGERAGADGELRLAFADEQLGLEAVLCYGTVPGTDVIRRWVELANTGDGDLLIGRLDSAAVNVAVPGGARLTYLVGQWVQEFQLEQIDLARGGFAIGSTQGVSGQDYAPWMAVQDASDPDGPTTPTWGVALAWSGSWHIDAQVDAGRLLRLRVGREPHEGEVLLPAGATLATPQVLLAFSPQGLGGLARVWHAHERLESRPRSLRPRPVLYNSWEATGFDVEQDGQLELARIAASIGAELFVVDDGWFSDRPDDTAGLGDWEPDPAAFPDGFGAFVDKVRGLGLGFGLWVEPEAVSPGSRLLAEHPDWIYAVEGRPATLIRNQLVLDLGRDEVRAHVLAWLRKLLTDHPISYLKWDMNRPPTERGRPGDPLPRAADLDAAHVANYHHILSTLRREHPDVLIEGCAGGGGRADAAAVAATDVVWPSDNTGPQDRLSIQHGFLHAHAPHVMSSWVTDSAGYFDTRPRSLRFRFVTAMAGALGIGADIRKWTPTERDEAAEWIARYKRWRETLHQGEVHLLGAPRDATSGVQYSAPDGSHEIVLAWNSGTLKGLPLLPGRPDRLRLGGLDPAARYREEASGVEYGAVHLMSVGLPCPWRPDFDADAVVLRRC
ncbi:alpha-galactosidase [Streptacidiphilus pinicola]|uniref:Alpha-galactosidase n=1 Tax=Streptacidiphilus pinicola TaxID=2219663 RepID=A0A2X0JHR0_9ACTN|nr:alpha-galactosidase [Streptacidiphilus pinicola]RAG87208.1 alpha-galactosidase [Streptacidiphilus pinicola]